MANEDSITFLNPYGAIKILGDAVITPHGDTDLMEISAKPGAEPLRIIVTVESFLAAHMERKS